MMRSKPYAFGFLMCGILVVLLFTGCTKREVDPTGIYLAAGGCSSYAEITRDASGNLMIKGSLVSPDLGSPWKVSFRKQKLILLHDRKWQTPGKVESGEYYESRTRESHDYYELIPSRTTPGDWDLVKHRFWTGFAKDRPSEEEMTQLKQPIPSYLHSLDDRRVVEYFNLADKYRGLMPGPAATRLFELASALLASYPDDLYVGVLYLDVLLRKGDYKSLEKRLTEWNEVYTSANNPFLRAAFKFVERAQYARQLSAAGRNAYDFVTEALGHDRNLSARVEQFPDILHYEEYAEPLYSSISPDRPHFIDFQISTKLLQVEAFFKMFQGKREEALKLLAACYHFGQLMNQSGPMMIESLIGSAFRSLACRGLRIYALNCCETPDEFQRLWETLEVLNRIPQETALAAFLSDFPDLYNGTRSIQERCIRHRTADTHFQLLRMAAAAKYPFVTEQAFPRSAEEFAPLLPEGPPTDPYTSGPLKFFSGPRLFTCYSVGPDEQDDRAAVSYDPTNGTESCGDIILEIPREREFPFSRDGVKAASADELRRQFTKGFPIDPFTYPPRGLGVTNTTPVYVYSVGTDRFSKKALGGDDRYFATDLYDPTNGTVSYGDLFIAIPR